MDGLFTPTKHISKVTIPLVPRCFECHLFEKCKSPKMPVYGRGKRKILIVGEGPGRNEDDQGVPFVGDSGQLLGGTLAKFGIDMDEDCWRTNAVICHPSHPDGSNRTPTPKEIDHCRPNVVNTIKELRPHVVILLGTSAVKSVLGWLWKNDVGLISRWDAWKIPCQKINAWVCPTWHPSYILRNDYGTSQRENDVRRMLFENHIEAMTKLKGNPWKNVPDWKGKVRIVLDHYEASLCIQRMYGKDKTRPIAFDYETTTKKPDGPHAGIWSCSMSDGIEAISFPWHGEAVKSFGHFLRSDTPKIASNMMFEDRWTRRVFGFKVRDWFWDTMTAARVLDNRPLTSGVKFQAFVRLGMEPWDEGIKEYFRVADSNKPNRIREIPLEKLLLYNSLDSLLEWHVARLQRKEFGIDNHGKMEASIGLRERIQSV